MAACVAHEAIIATLSPWALPCADCLEEHDSSWLVSCSTLYNSTASQAAPVAPV